jgi:Cu2+-exporting ATPase
MKANYDHKGRPKDPPGILKSLIRKNLTGGHSEGARNKNEENVTTNGRFQCPMKCEGERTYKILGICPVCNMQMVPEGCGFLYY